MICYISSEEFLLEVAGNIIIAEENSPPAKNAFTKRKELLTRAFSLCLKKRIIKTVICSTLDPVWSRIGDVEAAEL